MKKLLIAFLLLPLLFISVNSFSQPAAENEGENQEKQEKKEKKGRKKVFTIGEVVVHDKAIANIEKATTSTFITDEDIAARGEKDLSETLKMVPGINVFQHSKGSMRFQMRGQDLDRVAILIDGMPLQDIYEATLDISQLSALNVSRIVVNRGISSVLYGNNSIAGSINIITKRPETMNTSLMTEYGLYNNYTVAVNHGAPIGDFYYQLHASVSGSDGYSVSSKLTSSKREEWWNKLMNPGAYGFNRSNFTMVSDDQYINDEGSWDNTSFTKVNTSLRLGYMITDDLEVGLSLRYFFKKQESNNFATNYGSSYDSTTSTWSDPATAGFKDSYANDNMFGGFQNRVFDWPEYHNYSISPYIAYNGDIFSIRANLFYTQQYDVLEAYGTQDKSAMFFPFVSHSAGGNDNYYSNWINSTTGFNILPSFELADWNRLNIAFLFRHDTLVKREGAISASESPNLYAIFGDDYYRTQEMASQFYTFAIEDEIRLFDNLEISIGLSYDSIVLSQYREYDDTINSLRAQDIISDHSSIFGTRDGFSGVLGVVYTPIEDFLTLRTAGSIRTRLPNLAVLEGYVNSNGSELKNERSYNTNIGFIVSPFSSEVFSIGLDYFFSFYEDKFEKTYNPLTGTSKQYWNVTEATTHGIELTLGSEYEDLFDIMDINLHFTYTLLLINHDDETEIAYYNQGERPENTPTHQFIFDLRFAFITKTSLVLTGVYQLDQIAYVTNGNPGVSFYTTDAWKQVQLNDPFMMNIRVSQELYENFELWVQCKNIFDDYNADPFTPGPGRMWYFGAKVTL